MVHLCQSNCFDASLPTYVNLLVPLQWLLLLEVYCVCGSPESCVCTLVFVLTNKLFKCYPRQNTSWNVAIYRDPNDSLKRVDFLLLNFSRFIDCRDFCHRVGKLTSDKFLLPHKRRKSLGITGDQLRAPFKPFDTIVLLWSEGSQGLPLIGPHDAEMPISRTAIFPIVISSLERVPFMGPNKKGPPFEPSRCTRVLWCSRGGFSGAPNWSSMMPRDVSLPDSRCNFFPVWFCTKEIFTRNWHVPNSCWIHSKLTHFHEPFWRGYYRLSSIYLDNLRVNLRAHTPKPPWHWHAVKEVYTRHRVQSKSKCLGNNGFWYMFTMWLIITKWMKIYL